MIGRRLKTVTTINGRKVPSNRAQISVFDNSLLYGEGLFETLLAIEDRIVFIDEHLDRLRRGAKTIGLNIPADRSTLARWMKRTARAHPDRIKKLRLTVTAGEAARWVGVQGKSRIILSASSHQLPEKPFRLLVSDFRVDHQSVFRRTKTISYAIHAAALKQAHARGADDALMLNEAGRLAEVTSANIFWVCGERVFTPPVSDGCLEGVTRAMLFDAAADTDLRITEKDATMAELLRAEEIFITSSLKLVIGVSQIITGTVRHRFKPGPVTDRLQRHMRYTIGL